MRLKDRFAIVTGAASGIGWAITAEFLRQGAKVSLFDVDVQAAGRLLNDFGEFAERAELIEVDVSDEQAVDSAVAAAQSRFGEPTILVNCAATQTPAATVEELSVHEWTKAFAINVTGTFLVSRAVLPLMRAGGGGAIIHIASQLGSVGVAGFSAYCATKGAILQLTRTMALDHASENIRINSLSPGATLTERLRTRYGTNDAASKALGHLYPMGRLGEADEIAKAAVFLASDDSSFVTGTDLVVDGGYLAR